MGFTGNYVAGIWMGNDDYSPTKRMTGGSLPAMTWHEVMEYAHQGIELKTIPGVGPNPAPSAPAAVADASKGSEALRPAVLTQKGAQVLLRVERIMEEAARALMATPGSPDVRPAAGAERSDAFASMSNRPPPGDARGN
jgi:penicillin-binding protein 1A